MSDESIRSIVRSIREAFNNGNVEEELSFFTDDATFIRPEGTFKGKEEIKRYHTWSLQHYKELALTETDLIVSGNKAVLEFISEGTTTHGMKQRLPGILVFHFKDGKVEHAHDYYDRLLITQQLAKGWFAKRVVGAVVNRMEKGLR